jgi:hypothetical protein
LLTPHYFVKVQESFHLVNDVRQTEIQTEPLVLEPSAFEVEMAID